MGVGIDLRRATNECGHAPARKEYADHHDQGDKNRRDAGVHELGGSFGGAEPSTGSETAENAESLQLFEAVGSFFGDRGGGHFARLKDPLQDEQAAREDDDWNPPMGIAQHDNPPRWGTSLFEWHRLP